MDSLDSFPFLFSLFMNSKWKHLRHSLVLGSFVDRDKRLYFTELLGTTFKDDAKSDNTKILFTLDGL